MINDRMHSYANDAALIGKIERPGFVAETATAQSSAEVLRSALVEANTLAARAMSIVTMICGHPKNYQGCDLAKDAMPPQSGVLPEIIDQAGATRRTIKEAHDRLSDLEREFS